MPDLSRREVLAMAGVASAWSAASPIASSQQGKTRLGASPSAFGVRSHAGPFDIIEHCHRIGLGAVQKPLESVDIADPTRLRERVENYGMQLILEVPVEESQLPHLETALKACKAAGAYCLHTAMTQRRYEQFDSLEGFRKDFERCQNLIARAEPILKRNRLKLAIENHKGWRAAEQAAWLKRLGSEWVGVCLDFGNNMALCEDPMDTVRILTPYAVMSHIKDMALGSYEDGFLLSEVVLGKGILNLREMVRMVREKDANMPIYLEMITRDPLKIPVFTDKYWLTFDDSYSPLPGRDLAKFLDLVRKNPPKEPLPHTTGLSPAAAVKFEDDNNAACIDYARNVLSI
jgi:sugar phosphate isomerase/epimerase